MNGVIHEAAMAAGGYRALGRLLGISHQAIRIWGDRVPAERVLDMERATGISRQRLRPDLYGPSVKEEPARLPNDEKLAQAARRAAARAVHMLLASDPDILGSRDAMTTAKRLSELFLQELKR